jgi:XTP/dITP diphosphohydrolase
MTRPSLISVELMMPAVNPRPGVLLLATHNPGKVREYEALLADLPLEITYLDREGIDFDVEETGSSFAENALLKARAYAGASGLLTLADDSGLEVDALGGEPGVYSSRYAGPGASDASRYRLLLRKLQDVPWEGRDARFRCVVVVARPDGTARTAEGVCEGVIAFAPRGTHGFGYDPVFYLPQCGCTMAELSAEVKNRISHRGRAVQRARAILQEWLLEEGLGRGDSR